MTDESSERLAEEHEQLRRLYAESQARFADVFRLAPCVMLITRLRDHTILDVNQAFVSSSGYPREAVIGRPSTQFPWWQDTELRARVLTALDHPGYVSNIETRFLDREGREHFGLLSGQRISMDGEACVVWQTLDITENVRAQNEKRDLEERISQKEKLESLGVLAGGIAHDFNNLLVGVLGNAEAALFHLTPKSPAYPLVRSVVTSGERAADLTRELLDYAGRGTTRLAPVETLSLLWETSELVRPAMPSNVSVRMESSEMHLWVQGDASQLRRLFMNLIKNAAEAFEGGIGHVLIAAQCEQRAGQEWVCVRVRDQGRGMDENTRSRVFEPFFTTKNAGHGLGLAAAQGIAYKHGGQIEVTSSEGEGTTFMVRLPRRAAPEIALETDVATDFVGRGTLLLIDDEPNVRATTGMLLELHGFEVAAAESGEAGLALFGADPARFVAVVLDSTMPGIDGAETLRRLRAISPALPVLMCSGYAKHDVASLLEQNGHTGFLGKPFRRRDLIAALKGLLSCE